MHLTPAECCVLARLLEGETPHEIARAHGRSQHTVEWHIEKLHRKFDV